MFPTMPDPQLIAALIFATIVTVPAALYWWFNSDQRREMQAKEAARTYARSAGRRR